MELVDHYISQLKQGLRGLFNRLLKGELELVECLNTGYQVIDGVFSALKADLQSYYKRLGLVFPDADWAELHELYLGCVEGWKRILADYEKQQKTSQQPLLISAPSSVVGNQVRWDGIDTALVVFTGFWLTLRGLKLRVDILIEDFIYSTTNTSLLALTKTPQYTISPVKQTVIDRRIIDTLKPVEPITTDLAVQSVIFDAVYVQWNTEQDDKVCSDCLAIERGGINGTNIYHAHKAPSPPPMHPNCRCTLTVIFESNHPTPT